MKILHFISKYSTRILLITILLLIVFIFVSNFNKSYTLKSEKIKNTENIESAVCRIVSFPVKDTESFSFDAIIEKCENKPLKGLRMNIVLKGGSYNFLPGDSVKIKDASVMLPSEKDNAGSFDEIKYKKSLNLHGSIYPKEKAKLYNRGSNSVLRSVAKLRNRFQESTAGHFGKRYGGIVNALFAGDKSGIFKEDTNNLKNSGVYHIVAISGLHLNIFIMFVSIFISRLKMKRLKKALLSFAVCTCTSVAVLIFTGFGLSVIRAFVMLVISLGSSVFARKYDSKYSLLIATAIILILIPQSFFSIGFRLSVMSTYAVLVSGEVTAKLSKHKIFRRKLISHITGIIVTSLLCSAFTLPVMMNSFGFLPVYSFLANMLILPLTTPALALCTVFGFFSFAGADFAARLVSYPLNLVIWLILKIAGLTSSLPCAVLNLYPLYTFYAVSFAAVLGLGIYCTVKGKPKLCISISLIFTLAAGGVFLYNTRRDCGKVIFADVGQGECAIVILPDRQAVMIDFGTNYGNEYVTQEIKSSLVKYNIPKLSALFISHFHTDHMSGAVSLLNEKYAASLFVPEYYDKTDSESVENYNSLLGSGLKKPAELHRLKDGDRVDIGGGVFEILSPDENMKLEANDMSMVIKFTYGDVSFLFTGDIEESGTGHILEKDIKCNVIKVPHHGGENSKNTELARAADAEFAVISCGKNNSYKHPYPDTLSVFENSGADIYRTDTMGAVIFEFDMKEIKKVKKMR